MFLLEHHGKELLADHGIPVPPGCFVESGTDLRVDDLPVCDWPVGGWMVKAQVASGGRGKSGAIRSAATLDEIVGAITALAGGRVNGKPIEGFRIERRVAFSYEAYLSFSIAEATGDIRLMVSASGGVDVEAAAAANNLDAIVFDPARLSAAAHDATVDLPAPFSAALHDAACRLGEIFLSRDATLLEINPLFILADGSWIAGDVKLVLDDDAIVRQPATRALLEANAALYPGSTIKLAHGFDYVEIDSEGEIGLVTTGAGLSMKLIDELVAQGHAPLNFCDIRSGQFRGDPGRLINVLRWISECPRVGVVLVNIFAGITDLGEFARLLVTALGAAPELRVPIVARLIGRNLDEARRVLAASGFDVTVEPNLERAIERVLGHLSVGDSTVG